MKASTEQYDLAFETLMRLAYLAKNGVDVGKILVDAVNNNIDDLVRVPEFKVAVGFMPRRAATQIKRKPGTPRLKFGAGPAKSI